MYQHHFMSRSTVILFIIGIALLIYGYLCRLLNIYFFWDSKYFGWILIVTGALGLMIDLKEILTAQKRNILLPRIGIGIIILLFAYYGSAIIILRSSYIYKDAVEQIKTGGQMKNEVGDLKGFGLIPSVPGVFSIINDMNSGLTEFTITVRGDKAYREVKIGLEKTSEVTWTIISVSPVYY